MDGLVEFLVKEKGFRCGKFPSRVNYDLIHPHSEERVRKGAEKLQKFLNSKQQGRLDGFFTVKPKDNPTPKEVKGKGKGGGKVDPKAKGTKRKASTYMTHPNGRLSWLPQVDDKAESSSGKKARTKK